MPSLRRLVAADARGGHFKGLVDLACSTFAVPTAVVTVLTGDQAVLWTNSDLGVRVLPRAGSIADRLASAGDRALWVSHDVRIDPRLGDHPLQGEDSAIRFFAGVAMKWPDGSPAGAFSLLGPERQSFDPDDAARLRQFGRLAETMLAGLEHARRSEERLATLKLVEQLAGVGHWRFDLASGDLHWSDEVKAMHGLAGGLPLDVEIAKTLYPDNEWERLTALNQRAMSTGEGYKTRFRLEAAGGDSREVLAHTGAERNAEGEVVALFGVMQDVTDQQVLLRSIQQSEARYRLLAENVGDVITRVRPDGASHYISPGIQRLLGWSSQEMSGRGLEYVHPDDRGAVRAALQQASGSGHASRLEHRALHRDGSVVWVECTFKSIEGETEDTGDIIVVIRDIARRKALEQELRIARDRAEAAVAAKSDFLANMSHELRTPLTSVVGFANLLQKSDRLTDAEVGYVDRIATASDALLGVINDILDYSKLEAGGIDLDPRPFDPCGLVSAAAGILEPQCAAKSLDLRVEFAPHIPSCLVGDDGRLRQILLNLLSNAAKFTSDGGIAVSVSSHRQPDGFHRLRIAVADTGIGVAPERLASIFDRFSQADSSTTRLYGGTGLGLAISRRLIEIMGGRLDVTSQPGQGSTFAIEVDLPEGELAPESRQQVVAALRGHVLVADDAAPNRELISTILTNFGLDVDVVEDGAAAVQAWQARPYDLVLMDMQMPVMDGLEATRQIRALERDQARQTPILALSANTGAEQIERCLDAGMDGHLAKPIQLTILLDALSRHLSRST